MLVKIQSVLHNSLPIAREYAVESCEKKMTFNLCHTTLYGIGVMHGIVISNYGQFDSEFIAQYWNTLTINLKCWFSEG